MLKKMRLITLSAVLFLCFNSTAQTTKNAGEIFLVADKAPLTSTNAPAQLTYLGEDETGKKIDGYVAGKKTTGLVMLNGKYYFATPNGNFYQTEGNETSTKIIEKFTPQNFMYLAATQKYIYYAKDFGGGLVKDFVRYNPVSEKITATHFADNTYKQFTVNGNEVPGNAQTVDEVYVSPDSDQLFIRAFTNDMFSIYALSDNSEDNLADHVYSSKLVMTNISTPISTNTEVSALNKEVYFNGRVKPTGTYETSVNIYKPTETNKNKYEFKISFQIKEKKATIYDRFLRTKNAMYSLIKIEDSIGKYHHDVFLYNGKSITGAKEILLNNADDYNAQVIDGVIYVSYKGAIWTFIEEKSKFNRIYFDDAANESWDYIQKNKRFLKAGNYLLYSKGKKFGVYNLITKKSMALKNPVLANQPNFFTYSKTYVYAGNNSFYFMDNVNGQEVFTQYNPANNSYTPFVFPEFKKQSFGEIKAIYQTGNKFVFLTSYIGKKDKPEYKMFMYSEGGNETVVAVPEVKPTVKVFNAKLFEQQVNSIIAEPKNGFKNILGDVKNTSTNSTPINASTVAVEGIGDGTIINYKDSRTFMYTAETNRMFKEDAAAIMETIEKQLQKIKLPFSFTKIINYDVASRRFISYEFNGKMATIDLDMLRGTDAENAPNWTVTFRVRK